MNLPLQIGRFAILLCFLLSQSCKDKCTVTNTYTYYKPVYSTSESVRNSVRLESARTLKNPGRIYYKDNYLFINENGEGIHVIDNIRPSSPTGVGFLKIPGNYDLSISGNYLYADSFSDVVVFDISDKNSIREVKRIERVFDQTRLYGFPMESNNFVLTGWERVSTVDIEHSDCSFQIQPWGGMLYSDGIALHGQGSSASAPSTNPSSTGIGGSMMRFAINETNLYVLDGRMLNVIDIKVPADARMGKEIEMDVDPETLFPFRDKLFVGSSTGMGIYDLSSPNNPSFVSNYAHVRSCDPVVVDDTYAYVTLRSGSICQGFTNQLEVIDITNVSDPKLIKTYPLTNPHGLGIDQNLLFVCDGGDGLKVFDADDVTKIDSHQLGHYPGIKAIDIIPHKNIAMMIAEDGLYQYDYSDLKHIYLLSKLSIPQ